MLRTEPFVTVARVCAAIIRDGKILMVQHRHDGRSYWTLPGGGVEWGESPSEAVVREVHEETGLKTQVSCLLWQEELGVAYKGVAKPLEQCSLREVTEKGELALGYDPEEAQLDSSARMLQDVAWFTLECVQDDVQGSKVITALRT